MGRRRLCCSMGSVGWWKLGGPILAARTPLLCSRFVRCPVVGGAIPSASHEIRGDLGAGGAMETLERILLSIPWFAWIAIAAILAKTVRSAIRMTHEHEERMESLRQGIGIDREGYSREC